MAWEWNEKRSAAALLLAEGHTEQHIADTLDLERKTLWNWKQSVEFSAEVDRLSLMVGISSRAERLRIAMRVVREKIQGEKIDTQKDILDWIKYAQGETDGIKLELVKQLASITETEALMAAGRQDRESESETVQ